MVKKTKVKWCTKCGDLQPISEFYEEKLGRNGLRSDCKRCERKRARKFYKKHKIKYIKYNRDKRQTLKGYLYHRFQDIIYRCNNPKRVGYKNYGGRGIKCKFRSVDEFINYVINELKIDPRGLQIDRINNDGHYEPGNIRFITCSEDLKNRRPFKVNRKRKKI